MKKWLASHKVPIITLAVCLAVVLTGLITLSCMLLTLRESFPRPQITPEDWMRQSRAAMKAMQLVMQAEPGRMQEIVLEPADAAALLKIAVNNDQIGTLISGRDMQGGVPWTVTCNQLGQIRGACIIPTGIRKINCILQFTVMISYANNTFRITPVECKVGSVTIPNSIITEHVLPRVQDELEKNVYIHLFHRVVESISRDEKYRIVIRFWPDKAKMLTMSLF